MPSTLDIRRRIKSVKSTSQITKAMQMVAASRMRRAQQSALAGRPYAQLMNQILGEVSHHAGDFRHPLMESRSGNKVALIVVSTDKGLCGGLNSNLMREAAKYDKATTRYVTAGRKASQFVARTKRQLMAEFSYKDTPLFTEARAISRFAQDLFLKGEVDQVQVLFTRFISTLTQKPEVRQLLPVGQIRGAHAGAGTEAGEDNPLKGPTEFLFEPGADQVLGALLPHTMNFEMYQILLEAKASEFSARMVAMKNATDNAQQLIKDLTLEYNKLRQADITEELLEISSAALAVA
jgi:F-type H+-transporting ATPase subunit gamma